MRMSALVRRFISCWVGDGMQASAHHAGLPAVYYMFCSRTLTEIFSLFGFLTNYWFFVTCSEKTLLSLSDMSMFILQRWQYRIGCLQCLHHTVASAMFCSTESGITYWFYTQCS